MINIKNNFWKFLNEIYLNFRKIVSEKLIFTFHLGVFPWMQVTLYFTF